MKTVSIVQYRPDSASLKKSIDLCGGFNGLKPSDRVLIKPNLLGWDDEYPIAPFGVYTTTRLVEDLIIALKEFGCADISVGEGSVVMKKGIGTKHAFEGLGYNDLVQKHGIKLIDFNDSAYRKFTFHDDLALAIAEEALDADFLIDFAVMKTHAQSKVSLGIKNLKGCIDLASRRLCHHPGLSLDYCFSHIADFIKPDLTIIDGIYALERGAFHFGNAYRKDIIVASRDILGADITAAALMGIDPVEVAHFNYYAERNKGDMDPGAYELAGEKPGDHTAPLKWDWHWTDDNTGPGPFAKMGITGTAIPKYDETLCTGCSTLANTINILVMSAFQGRPLPAVEILNGKRMLARPGYDRTVRLGNCIIRANRDNPNINEAVPVKGCPPTVEDLVAALRESGLDVKPEAYTGYLKQQSEKYEGKEGYDRSLYRAR